MRTRSNLEKIITAAEKLFGQRGYDAVSISDIAKKAGTSKSLIYHHFKDKDELYEQIVEKGIGKVVESISQVITSELPPEEKLKELIHTYLKCVIDNEALYRSLVRETANFASHSSRLVLSHSLRLIEEIRKIIQQGIRTGTFKKLDAEVAAFTLFGMMNSFVVLKAARLSGIKTAKKQLELEKAADIITEIFIGGLSQEC